MITIILLIVVLLMLKRIHMMNMEFLLGYPVDANLFFALLVLILIDYTILALINYLWHFFYIDIVFVYDPKTNILMETVIDINIGKIFVDTEESDNEDSFSLSPYRFDLPIYRFNIGKILDIEIFDTKTDVSVIVKIDNIFKRGASLKGSLLHFWINIQASLRVLKDDLLRTAKLFFRILQLFLKEFIKKGVTNPIEVLKRFFKNERVLNWIASYLSFVLILLALVLLYKILTRK